MTARAFACLTVLAAGCGPPPTGLDLSTWSIAALDPVSGDVGVAVASCVPNAHADAVAALVPGVGVAVTQARWHLGNRNRVYEALIDGIQAEAIIDSVANPEADAELGYRQYGVVTLTRDAVGIAGFTGDSTPGWSGVA